MVFIELARSFWYFLDDLVKERIKSYVNCTVAQVWKGNNIFGTAFSFGKKSCKVNLTCAPHVHHQVYMERI
jgi:uncharacterized membrane protein